MRLAPAPHLALVPLAAALALAGCGGGGGDAAAPAAAPPTVVLSGVAATGAPMAGAAVRVLDANGNTACSTTASASGEYRCDLGSAPRAPFTVIAETDTQRHYSVAPRAESGTVNVTPLTTLIVARLAPDGNPASLADALKADPGAATLEKVQARVAEVSAMLAPLTGAVGDSVNPLSGRFAADGTGHDRVLDALQVSIRPEADASNIQVTIKAQPASDSAAPVEIAFRSSDTTPPPAPAITLRAADLPPQGIAAKLDAFLRRMQACYALPLATRIAGVAAGAAQATGTAESVQAPACRTLFVGDDPAGYLDNGFRVGSSGAFPGMFRESSTGVVYDVGSFEYRWANGDLFVTFRATTTAGAVAYQALTLREEGTALKAVGNQYVYDALVRPYGVDREFPLQPAYSFLGTGYSMAAVNRVDPATNLPMFREVRVTAPRGQTFLLKPQVGRSLMGIVRANGSNSGSSVQLLAARYQSPQTPGNPKDKDPGYVFAGELIDDQSLRASPNQGAWTFEFVHVDDTLSNVVQTYRTISRALSIGELRQTAFAQFGAAQKEQWLQRDDVAGGRSYRFGAPSAEAPTRFAVGSESTPGWTVPEGAIPVTTVTIFGSSINGTSFNDAADVSSLARSVTISCSRQSAADPHCDDSTGVLQFAAGSRVVVIELLARGPGQAALVKHLAWFRLAE